MCGLLAPARKVLEALTPVRVLVGENDKGAATGVDIPTSHAYTARCDTMVYGVDRFVALVPHQLEHVMTRRAQLGGVVLVHLPELYAASRQSGEKPPRCSYTGYHSYFV